MAIRFTSYEYYKRLLTDKDTMKVSRNGIFLGTPPSYSPLLHRGEALTQLNFIMSFALDESAPVSMGSLLVPRHYPNLEILRLTDFPLHLKELKRFLECLNGPICFFMDELWLLSGTWAEALDLIREKAWWESYVVRQHGAECDDMSEEDYEAIFGKDRLPSLSDAGTATRYVRGMIKNNPLSVWKSTLAA
ncbi:hypothetical protein DPV78_007634 [Talaromyces pinophilus]|nr:hypothetical protein DPV78_007634 [Talaromyces pinophilus]